jgi:hypothetical protein
VSSLPPHLDDSLLPAEPAWSFVFAYEAVRGRGATHGALAIAGKQVMPETWRTWIEPLSTYVIFGKETTFSALPYSRLALLAYSIAIEWADRPREVETITRRIGRQWWSGNNVISRTKPLVNVQTRLGGAIQHRFYEQKHLHQHDRSADAAEGYGLAALALHASVTTLSDWSGISCHSMQSPNAARVDIPHCPFCLYNPSHCQIFLGLLDGMVDWLDMTIGDVGMTGRLEVNLSQSSGHTIMLDWNAAAQMESRDHG